MDPIKEIYIQAYIYLTVITERSTESESDNK